MKHLKKRPRKGKRLKRRWRKARALTELARHTQAAVFLPLDQHIIDWCAATQKVTVCAPSAAYLLGESTPGWRRKLERKAKGKRYWKLQAALKRRLLPEPPRKPLRSPTRPDNNGTSSTGIKSTPQLRKRVTVPAY